MSTSEIPKVIPFTELGQADITQISLQRLQRLVMLKSRHTEELNQMGIRLVESLIVDTLRDCRQLGVTESAREILNQIAQTS